jgi:hypothetical protein
MVVSGLQELASIFSPLDSQPSTDSMVSMIRQNKLPNQPNRNRGFFYGVTRI